MDMKEVRESRNTAEAAFLCYSQEKRRNPNHLFCFFEGEDIKYYLPRIERYSSYKHNKITHYQ